MNNSQNSFGMNDAKCLNIVPENIKYKQFLNDVSDFIAGRSEVLLDETYDFPVKVTNEENIKMWNKLKQILDPK